MTARHPEKGEEARQEVIQRGSSDRVHLLLGDSSSFESTRSLAGRFMQKFPRLDVLVNNAGAVLSDRRVTEDGFEMTFQVNHLAHFLLTGLLLERLQAAPRARHFRKYPRNARLRPEQVGECPAFAYTL